MKDCVLLSTGAQPSEETADLRKVMLDSASTNLERTPVMVEGKLERFRDIGSMITKWEKLKQDDKEWMVEEGVRRGGRKLSRRMSELIGIFGEENASVVGLTSDGIFREDNNLFSLTSISVSLSPSSNILPKSSKKTEKLSSIEYNRVRSKSLFIDEKTLTAGCDWPVGITSNNLPTNESGGSRKKKFDGDRDGGGETKKVRMDESAILDLG